MSEDLYIGERYATFSILIELFNLFKDNNFQCEDAELKNDIEKSIEVISIIEISEEKRKPYHKTSGKEGQEYKGFNLKNIRILDSIMVKNPLTVGVGFESYHSAKRISSSKPIEKVFNEVIKNVLSSQLKKGLPCIRFCLDVQEVSFDDDNDVRNVLTYGIFYYLDQLIRENFLRPRRCGCKKWFLPIKNDQFSCRTKCRNARRSN